ncbi:MAG: radical SAM protein, partial [Nitrospirota bacterium]
MRTFLAPRVALKRLEFPALYDPASDELYELDEEAFRFLSACASEEGCEAPGGEVLSHCLKEGILLPSPHRAQGRRPSLHASGDPSLRYLELQLTRRCNLRCGHCFLGAPSPEDLSVRTLRRVLDEFEEMQGLRVILTGGEPLLHPDFQKINELLPRYALRTVLLTNGVLPGKGVLRGLHVHELQVSLDGLHASHDALRGEGTFGKALGTIEEALRTGFHVSVSTMVHARNLGDFAEMEKLLRSLGVREWTVDVPAPEGRMRGNLDFELPPEVAGPYLAYGYGEGLHGGGREGYACGLHLMSVTAGGLAAKCSFYAGRPVGHVEEGLRTCWERIRPVRLKELVCASCPEGDACRGGCRYRAALAGDPLGA